MTQRIQSRKKSISLLLSCWATVLLVSCSSGPRPDLSIDSVSIYAEPDANDNSAIAIDLVLVYDLELMKTLGQMSASKYFSASKQLLLDNPTLVDVWHWELVPGQIVDKFVPDQEDGDAFGAYVFANYLTPGDHRVKVAPDGVIKILLLKDDLKNFAVFNSTDPKLGQTVTNRPKTSGSSDDASFEKAKMGPVTSPGNPCDNITEKAPSPQPIACDPCKNVPQNDPCAQKVDCNPMPLVPIPITTRPLGAPLQIKPCIQKNIR